MSGITQVITEPNSGCKFEVSVVSNVIGYYFKLGGKKKGIDDFPVDVNSDQRSICFPRGHGDKA